MIIVESKDDAPPMKGCLFIFYATSRPPNPEEEIKAGEVVMIIPD